MQKRPRVTIVGTNIDEVKIQNANSGLSYNQAKQLLARKCTKNNSAINLQRID